MVHKKIQWKNLIVCILIPIGVGFLSSFLIKNNIPTYVALNKPPLAASEKVFPVAWTIFYFLMGISSYLIFTEKDSMRKGALCVYGIQLALNFIWPLIFFNTQLYFLALLILIVLWILVFVMIIAFMQVDIKAAWIQYPYLIWLTYAGYLNLGIFFLNMY